MAKIYIKKLFKFGMSFVVGSALLLGFFCIGMFHETSMRLETSDRTMMAIASEKHCCGSTMSEHITTWKDTFLVVSREMRDALALFVLGLILGFVFIRSSFNHAHSDRGSLSYRLYLRQNPDIFIFNHLRFAFARGILNQKVF